MKQTSSQPVNPQGVRAVQPPPALQLEAIVDSSEDAIITKTLDGIITSWNPAAERIFCYSADEAIHRPISIIVPPERGQEEIEVLTRLRRGEPTARYETERVARDGRHIPVLLTVWPIQDSAGNAIGASTIIRDISEQKQSIEQLRIERDRLRVTLASIGDAVIVTDSRGFIDFLNAVAERLTGWTQQEAKGKPLESVFCIVNETTRQRVESPASVAMREGIVVGLANHTLLISKDGVEVAIDDSAAPIRDSSGRVLGVVLVFRDVTSVRAVDVFRERLSAIVESSDDAIVGKDLNGRITSWNKGAERIFGYSQQEALGRPITMLIPADRLAEETEILRRLRQGERLEHFETIRVAKDRRLVEVSLTISPIRDSDGTIIGASKIARDITEKKESERQLDRAHAQLKEHVSHLDQLVAARTAELTETVLDLETFASSLSHDLRAPLRTVCGLASSLKHDFDAHLPAEAKDMVERIEKSCDRLSQFVDAVLSYMRIRNESISLEDVSLEQIVHEVVEDFPYVREANAEVEVQVPLLPVKGNSGLLTQVLSNLISNAVKFVAAGARPRVRIWTERADTFVRVWIEDNGIGISAADQNRIFELFCRTGASEPYEGSGVGLAVVQRAVRRMGGRLGLKSSEGRGSSFWVDLLPADARTESRT